MLSVGSGERRFLYMFFVTVRVRSVSGFNLNIRSDEWVRAMVCDGAATTLSMMMMMVVVVVVVAVAVFSSSLYSLSSFCFTQTAVLSISMMQHTSLAQRRRRATVFDSRLLLCTSSFCPAVLGAYHTCVKIQRESVSGTTEDRLLARRIDHTTA